MAEHPKRDWLVENLRGMCAYGPTVWGYCAASNRELKDYCTSCYAAAEIERLRREIEGVTHG